MKRYIIIIAALLSLTGCTDYLDIKPYGKTIPKTTEEFAALVDAMCDGIDKGSTLESEIAGSYSNSSTLEAVSDNLATNLTGGSDRLRTYIGQDLSSKQSNYKNLYQIIRNCNIVLSEFKDGRDTRAGKDIVGTCYAIRGVCYYQLLRMFCAPPLAADAQLGVPIVTGFDMEAMPVRSTIQETIAQAEHDMKQAVDYDIQNEMYRFNNDVMHGYLARLYHWCGRWQEARDMALSVLERHPLLSGDAYVTMMTTQYGLVGNKIFMADRLATSQLGLNGTWSSHEERPLSADLATLFVEGTNDIRRKSNLFFNRKRTNRKLFFTGMRSAEMAFIAMESAYHLGKQDVALAELNSFRSKRIISGFTAYTIETLPPVKTNTNIQQDATGKPMTPLLQAILNERRKELYLENGDRWFELKRNGRPEWWVAVNGQKYWTRKYMYTWPIPLNDIQQQPALIQNPGYDVAY